MSDTAWFEKKTGAADRAFEYAETLDRAREEVLRAASRNYMLYDGRGDLVNGKRFSPLKDHSDMVSENHVKSVTDTALALVVNSTPRASFQTDGADFSVQRRAKELEMYSEGLFQVGKVYDMARLAFRDGCLATGFIKIAADNRRKRPHFERVTLDQVLVDEWQALDGNPPDVLQRYFVDKRKLAARFPQHKKAIMAAERSDAFPVSDGSHPASDHMVELLEGWRVPSAPGAGDGVHAAFINTTIGNSGTLFWEGWLREEVPFAVLRWTPPTFGFYGTPLVDEIAGIQLKIHEHNDKMEEMLERLAYPRVWVQKGDMDLAARLVPQIGVVGAYTQQPPITEAPRVIPPDLFTDRDRLGGLARSLPGISDFAAFAKKPADVRSGPGFRELSDTQSQRFIVPHMAWEQFILDISRHALEVSKEMFSGKDMDPEVMWRSRDRAKRIQWSKVGEDFETYAMHISAASILARSPAGRKDMAMDLFNAQMIGPEQAMRLLDLPDIEREHALEMAASKNIDATIERLEDGEIINPDDFQDLVLGVKRVTQNYNRLLSMGESEPRTRALEAHRQWVAVAELKLKEREQAQQAKIQQQAVAEGQIQGQAQAASQAEQPTPIQ